jgi:F0F1-type ATP synthase membrane subunit b/b'
MRRPLLLIALWGVLLFGCSGSRLFAQGAPAEQEGNIPHDTLGPWKITNSLIFFLALGFALAKYGPPFFNARSTDIQKAIKDATGLKLDADYRYSEADRKMATLGAEVARLRAEGAAALEAQHRRMQEDTAAALERIRKNVALETEALRLDGIRQLRLRTTRAAFNQVESRLRDRAAAGDAHGSISDFIHLVESGQNG